MIGLTRKYNNTYMIRGTAFTTATAMLDREELQDEGECEGGVEEQVGDGKRPPELGLGLG